MSVQLPRSLRIEVTKEDIKVGKPRRCRECPIALATIRAVSPYAPLAFSSVNNVRLYLLDPKGQHLSAKLPIEAQDFIRDLDTKDRRGKPFAFELQFNDSDLPQ